MTPVDAINRGGIGDEVSEDNGPEQPRWPVATAPPRLHLRLNNSESSVVARRRLPILLSSPLPSSPWQSIGSTSPLLPDNEEEAITLEDEPIEVQFKAWNIDKRREMSGGCSKYLKMAMITFDELRPFIAGSASSIDLRERVKLLGYT
jgi:hypothetical protein